jgi:hypothetical protein
MGRLFKHRGYASLISAWRHQVGAERPGLSQRRCDDQGRQGEDVVVSIPYRNDLRIQIQGLLDAELRDTRVEVSSGALYLDLLSLVPNLPADWDRDLESSIVLTADEREFNLQHLGGLLCYMFRTNRDSMYQGPVTIEIGTISSPEDAVRLAKEFLIDRIDPLRLQSTRAVGRRYFLGVHS